jgi:hypothetical protein
VLRAVTATGSIEEFERFVEDAADWRMEAE